MLEPSENKTMVKSRRGFASMSAERQREIARKGGKTAHQRGTAHEFTPEEARVAGRKGGHASQMSARLKREALETVSVSAAAAPPSSLDIPPGQPSWDRVRAALEKMEFPKTRVELIAAVGGELVPVSAETSVPASDILSRSRKESFSSPKEVLEEMERLKIEASEAA